MSDKYYYAWVRRDIPPVAQIIQVSHATDRISLRQEYYEDVARMVLFESADERELLDVYLFLREKGLSPSKDFEIFYDSAWPRGFNAIVTRPFEGTEREIFADFNLYRDDSADAIEARKRVSIVDEDVVRFTVRT